MKKQILALTTLTVATALQLNAGDVTGKITLKGTPPPAPSIDAIKTDPNCGKFYPEVPKMKFFVVGAGGELADAVVTLKGDNIKDKSTGESAAPVVLDQNQCQYVPYVAAVQTKQKISVRNSDPVMHNVHPIPSAAGNKEANKAQMPKAPNIEFSFEKPEEFLKFKCDVHSWMFSYITVVDNPYFAVSDKDGTFTIKNVPDGKYTLEAAHRKGGKVSKEIEVKGGNVTQDLTIELK